MVPVLDPGRHGQSPVEGAGEGQGSQEVLGLVTEAACERWGSGGARAGDAPGMDRGMQREPHRGMRRDVDRGMQRGTDRGPRRGMKRGLHQGLHREPHRGTRRGSHRGMQPGDARGTRTGRASPMHGQ